MQKERNRHLTIFSIKMPSAFLDVVLGASARIAAAQTKLFDQERQNTVRVFSNTFNAPKRMGDEEVVTVFQVLGSLPHLERLELNRSNFRCNTLVLPALALARALQRARCLKDLLLAGIRLSGSSAEMMILAEAVLHHSSLKRLFINDCHPTHGSATLAPFLHAATTNPRLETLTVSHTTWAGHALYPVNHEVSCLKSLRLSGALCLDPTECLHLIESLQFSKTLKELRISDCALSPGIGTAVANLIARNQVLEEVVLELTMLIDSLPIAQALVSNTNLKRLELLVHCPESSAFQCFSTSLFADAMSINCYMHYFCLRSSLRSLSNPRLDFFLRLNRCGKRHLLEHPKRPLATEDWVDAIAANSTDVSILYYILLLNPALCQGNPVVGKTRVQSLPRRRCKRNRLE